MRMLPIRRRITDIPLRTAENIRLAISIDVHQPGRFVIHNRQSEKALPMPLPAFWVLIPKGLLAGKAIDHYVRPAIAVKVVGERQKIIRVRVDRAKPALESLDRFLRAIALL